MPFFSWIRTEFSIQYDELCLLIKWGILDDATLSHVIVSSAHTGPFY